MKTATEPVGEELSESANVDMPATEAVLSVTEFALHFCVDSFLTGETVSQAGCSRIVSYSNHTHVK